MLPLQTPGGIEFAVILLLFVAPLLILAAFLLLLKRWVDRSGGDDERIAELEAEVEALQQRVDELESESATHD